MRPLRRFLKIWGRLDQGGTMETEQFPINDETKFKISDDIVCRKNQDGTVVIMKMDDSDLFYKIHGVAAEMWHKFERGDSLGNILTELGNKYDVEKEVIQKDATAYLDEILKLEMVTIQ